MKLRLPESRCPSCGEMQNELTMTAGNTDVFAVSHAWIICSSCRAVLRVKSMDTGEMRVATDAEIEALPPMQRQQLMMAAARRDSEAN